MNLEDVPTVEGDTAEDSPEENTIPALPLSTVPADYLAANAPAILEAITTSTDPQQVAYIVGLTNNALQLVAQGRNQELAALHQQRLIQEAKERQEAAIRDQQTPPITLASHLPNRSERRHPGRH